MEQIISVVLAAGEGKRIKSKYSKVVHKVCGMEIIKWVCSAIKDAGVGETILVVGHKSDQVKNCMGDKVHYAKQEQLLGTGHAVMQAQSYFEGKDGLVLILCGDTPLITSETISNTIKFHKDNKNSATVISADLDDPTGYGRIVRGSNGEVQRIVEHKDASEDERTIKEVNSGMYCFTIKDLVESLSQLNNNNSQGEYYLTDTLEILLNKNLKVGAIKIKDNKQILGINNRVQLAEAANILKERILNRHMESGVTIIDPGSTFIDNDIHIGIDTIIYPSTILEGKTIIGEDCVIGPNSRIVSSQIGDATNINNSIVLESSVGSSTKVGPFAYIRPVVILEKK